MIFPSKAWAHRDAYAAVFRDAGPVRREEELMDRVAARFRSRGHLVLDMRGPLSVVLGQRRRRVYLPDGHLTPYANFVAARAVSLVLARAP